jgi:hypothetical protein
MPPFQSYFYLKLSLCLQDTAVCKNVAPQSLQIQDKLPGFANEELHGKGIVEHTVYIQDMQFTVS